VSTLHPPGGAARPARAGQKKRRETIVSLLEEPQPAKAAAKKQKGYFLPFFLAFFLALPLAFAFLLAAIVVFLPLCE
jgi:hypothetical protein